MIPYLIKTILCSALLLSIYHLFLEREKMHQFNRIYLLTSIAFSFLVPLITINVNLQTPPIIEPLNSTIPDLQGIVTQQKEASAISVIPWTKLLFGIYLMVSAILLIRFIINIFALFNKIRNNKLVPYQNAKLVLLNDKLVPHSFLNYIFMGLDDYENGRVEEEILGHELTHANQKHSVDILLIELLVIFVWINPVLFLYKRAIQLNHEFLADELVINKFSDTRSYQLLLLEKASRPKNLLLSSPFNYIQIKKRLIMMSKKSPATTIAIKQIALLPVLAALIFLFSTKNFAQENVKEKQTQNQAVESTKDGVSQDLLKEYEDVIRQLSKSLNGIEYFSLNLDPSAKEKLEKIFFQMNDEQKAESQYIFVPRNSMFLPRKEISKEKFESFKDPDMYGVWINGKRVKNKDLNNYSHRDFSWFFESKLAKNAKNYGKHVYQLDLKTNENYQAYYDNIKSLEGNALVPNPALR